jgi:hypothetical protein
MSELSFDKPTFDRLVIEHRYAVEKGHKSFIFDGEELVTDYAKYLIQFLEPKFRKNDNTRS